VCGAVATRFPSIHEVSFKALKSSRNYMSRLFYQSVKIYFVFIGFVRSSLSKASTYLNSINHLIFVMAKRGVVFEVRTKFISIIYMSLGTGFLGFPLSSSKC
jgi:hypothetical protein